MRKRLFIIALLSGAVVGRAADEQSSARAKADAVAPFMDDQAFAVYRLDVTRLDVDAAIAKIATLQRQAAAALAPARDALKGWIGAFTRAGGKELYVVFSLADLPQRYPFTVVPLHEGADADALAGLFAPRKDGPSFPLQYEVHEKVGGAIFAGSAKARERIKDLKGTPRPELVEAFAAAGEAPAQAVLVPTADMRCALEDALPTLPREFGGVPSTVLTRGIKWAAAAGTPPPRLSLRLVIRSEDAAAARALRQWVQGELKMLGGQPQVRQLLPDFAQVAGRLTPQVEGDRLTLQLDDRALTGVLMPTVLRVRERADRMRSVNHFRQIGIAMHSYLDATGHFPTQAIYAKDGKPLLSWRVAILPYVDQGELYKQFHLDEPWDSEHNKKLLARMPPVYDAGRIGQVGVVRAGPGGGKTTYLGVVGESAMFGGHKGLTIRDVTDGTSNTIWVVEADVARAVPWTKPEDFKYDPEHPLRGLGGDHRGGFNALFVDASVHFIPASIDPKDLRAFFTRNGGEILSKQY